MYYLNINITIKDLEKSCWIKVTQNGRSLLKQDGKIKEVMFVKFEEKTLSNAVWK